MVRKHKPSIIFIDDIDSLCRKPSDPDDERFKHSRRIKAEFIAQMQGIRNNMNGVLLVVATSVPWILDSDFQHCFEKRIYIPLPDGRVRFDMLKAHLEDTPHILSEKDLKRIAQLTEGYSGADISIVIREALMQPVRQMQKATHFKRVRGPSPLNKNYIVDDLVTPCSPSDAGAFVKIWTDVPKEKLFIPPITMVSFDFYDFFFIFSTIFV